MTHILSGTSSDKDKERLLAASPPHTGDWLHAPPIATVGLQLSDKAVRVAVAHRLGYKACEPHTCVCGKAVSARELILQHRMDKHTDKLMDVSETESYMPVITVSCQGYHRHGY